MSETLSIDPNEMPFQELDDMFISLENAEVVAEETLPESTLTGENGQNPDFILNQVARALKRGKVGTKKMELEASKEVKITRLVSMGEIMRHMLFTDPAAIAEILESINKPAVIAALKGPVPDAKLEIENDKEE